MAKRKWPIIDFDNIKTIDDIGFLGTQDRTRAQELADAKLASQYFKKMKEKAKRAKAGSREIKASKAK